MTPIEIHLNEYFIFLYRQTSQLTDQIPRIVIIMSLILQQYRDSITIKFTEFQKLTGNFRIMDTGNTDHNTIRVDTG